MLTSPVENLYLDGLRNTQAAFTRSGREVFNLQSSFPLDYALKPTSAEPVNGVRVLPSFQNWYDAVFNGLMETRHTTSFRRRQVYQPIEENFFRQPRADLTLREGTATVSFVTQLIERLGADISRTDRPVKPASESDLPPMVGRSPSGLTALQMAAGNDAEFKMEDVESVQEWVAGNPSSAFRLVHQRALHGRVRWLLLQELARTPTNPLRDTLAALLETPALDPWLLNGVAAIIRTVPMSDQRERTRGALAVALQRARATPGDYRDHLAGCALGELLQTFGSFAEPADIELLGSFVIGAWALKPSINALDALARTARRHCQSAEIAAFFSMHQEKLQRRGSSLLETSALSTDNTALLFGWLELMVARLGEEGQMAVALVQDHPMLRRRTAKAIEDALAALARRDVPGWFGPASARAAGWLQALSVI